MKLHSETRGTGRAVAFVHGFTQTSSSWNALLDRLGTPVAAQLIDAPGHGRSPVATRTLSECGADICETMNPGILVGYSMGARMSLHAALREDAPIEALVLLSGTAGIDDDAERAARRRDDEELADHIESVGVDVFLREWTAQPMFASLPDDPDEYRSRLTNTAHGLADSLRHAGTGTQQPLWDDLGRIRVPVLIIAGELDLKFTALAERLHLRLPTSRLELVDAGHSVHLENPRACAEVIDSWLNGLASEPVN